MKRVFGTVEAVFDLCYLAAALAIGGVLLLSGKTLMGVMALVLAGGDAFHLIPRVAVIRTENEEALRARLGRGKQITSITMTVFYLLLWRLSVPLAVGGFSWWDAAVYLLAAARIALCLLPQNRWADRYPPVGPGLARNVPFFAMGLLVAWRFFTLRNTLSGFYWLWLAVLLSFLFYLPVVVWANRNPKIGMLMLPKTCMYVWILVMCLTA